MKKMLLSATLFAAAFANAQNSVTYDDLTLTPNSYWDGSDSTLGFTSGGVYFENSYNFDWDYWSGGFIYSNSTDITTAGYTNDFSAFTGTGSNSSNYAVNYGGNIDFNAAVLLNSIDLTNTTYAALSMLNGDFYGKKFGSAFDANGDVDGTNGEDWFRLLIVGRDPSSVITDTVVFYLADYRFADSTQDYIVDTWETVDLSALGSVRYLEFTLESSDVGNAGMNTPAYFALDNLVYGTLGLNEEMAASILVYPNPSTSEFTVESREGIVRVFNAYGQLMTTLSTTGQQTINCSDWKAGSYILEFETSEGIARKSIIKN